MLRRIVGLCCGIIALHGCAAYTPVDVAKPSDITLEQATAQVASSLAGMKKILRKDGENFGLVIDQVDVDLNVTAAAGASGSQDLKIDAAKTAIAGLGLTEDVAGQQTSSAQRANTIHMTFKSIYTANLNCYPFTKQSATLNLPSSSTFAIPAPPISGFATPPPSSGTPPAAATPPQSKGSSPSAPNGLASVPGCNAVVVADGGKGSTVGK